MALSVVQTTVNNSVLSLTSFNAISRTTEIMQEYFLNVCLNEPNVKIVLLQ